MSLIFRENVRKLIDDSGLNVAEFAERIEEKSSRVNDVLNGKQRPPFDMIEKILSVFQIDANWLITGHKNPNGLGNISNEYEYIPFYDVEVSAGYGADAYGAVHPQSYLAFRKDWLRSRGLYPKDLSCVKARGDSMEPTINNGDTLLVDASRNMPRDGYIYVIRSADTLWVKRIQKHIDNSLLLISDNGTYPPMTLRSDQHHDIQIIGQVVNISKELI